MHSESKTRFVPTLIISWCVNLYWLFEKTIIAWTIWVNPWTCDQFDSVLKILMIQTSQKEQFIFVLEPLLKAAFPLHIPESEKLHFLSFYLHFFFSITAKELKQRCKMRSGLFGGYTRQFASLPGTPCLCMRSGITRFSWRRQMGGGRNRTHHSNTFLL